MQQLSSRDPVTVWPFIEAEQPAAHNVLRACDLLEVSRAAFYEHAKHEPSARELSGAELTDKITMIHAMSKVTYGSPRAHAELHNEGSVRNFV